MPDREPALSGRRPRSREEGVPDSFDDWASAGGDGCTFTAELAGGRLAFVGPAAWGSE